MADKEVKVIWDDAKSYTNEWLEAEEAIRLLPSRAITKGFLVFEAPDRIVVAQSKSNNLGHNFMAIPKGCIISLIIENEQA